MRLSATRRLTLALVLSALSIPLLSAAFTSQAYAHVGESFSAFTSTPPVIDGTISPGEWSDADSVDIAVDLPGAGTTPGTIFVMNDGTNLYVALMYEASGVDISILTIRFDNDHDGVREVGDDMLLGTNFDSFDDAYFNGISEQSDIGSGGTNDISGAFGDDGTFSVFELSHPLDSADDAHDFSLAPGDTTGVLFDLVLVGIGSIGITLYPSQTLDPNQWADIVIAAPEQTPVGGEILPTSMVTLFVAGAAANALWIIPVVGGAAAVALWQHKGKKE